jgi:protease I
MPFGLAAKKVLLVVAPDQFRDEELIEPRKALEAQGASVAVASTQAGPAVGMMGARVNADLAVSDARAADFDAVVVVGGMGSPAHLWEHAPLHSLLREVATAGGVIGAICLSGAVLAKAGLLRGKHATCWSSPEAVAAMNEGGALYEKARVVVDGRIVTADGPPSSREFGEALVRVLSE